MVLMISLDTTTVGAFFHTKQVLTLAMSYFSDFIKLLFHNSDIGEIL